MSRSPKLANVSQRYSFFTAGDDFKLMKARPNYSKVRIKGWDRTTVSHSVVDARSWIDSSKAVWVVLRRQLSFLYFWLNKRIMTKKCFYPSKHRRVWSLIAILGRPWAQTSSLGRGHQVFHSVVFVCRMVDGEGGDRGIEMCTDPNKPIK